MVSQRLKNASQLARKPYVTPDKRTTERDNAADWIETHAADNWQDWTLSRLADESPWSRPHLTTVLEHYFTPRTTTSPIDEIADQLDIDASQHRELLDDLTTRELLIYRLGYRDAIHDLNRTGNESD